MSTKRTKKKTTIKPKKQTSKEYNKEQTLLYTFDSLRQKTKKEISKHIEDNQERLNASLVKLNGFAEGLSKELHNEETGKLSMKDHLALIAMFEQVTTMLKMSAASTYLETLKKVKNENN